MKPQAWRQVHAEFAAPLVEQLNWHLVLLVPGGLSEFPGNGPPVLQWLEEWRGGEVGSVQSCGVHGVPSPSLCRSGHGGWAVPIALTQQVRRGGATPGGDGNGAGPPGEAS